MTQASAVPIIALPYPLRRGQGAGNLDVLSAGLCGAASGRGRFGRAVSGVRVGSVDMPVEVICRYRI